MLAKIIDISDEEVVLKGENGKFKKVKKSSLKFEYALGDTIEVDYDGERYYYVPSDQKFEPIAAPVIKKKASSNNKNDLVGISGALAALAIYLLIKLAGSLASFIQDITTNISCRDVSSIMSASVCNNLNGVIVLENVVGCIAILLLGIAVYLLFKCRSSARGLIVGLLIACLIWNIYDLILVTNMIPNTSDLSSLRTAALSSGAISIAVSVVDCCVIIPYLFTSKRVKNTLIK